MARLTLTLLGGFQARLGTGPPLTLPTKKIQAFLAYLALPPGREHTRDKLAALLWGICRKGTPATAFGRPSSPFGGPSNRLDQPACASRAPPSP
jgi:hypothetical protein